MSTKSNLDLARAKIKDFEASLPKRVDPASISYTAKIPFNALTYREALLHRVTELGDSAVTLFGSDMKAVSAIVLTRAVHETFASIYVLYTKIKEVVDAGKTGNIHDFLLTNTFGYRMKGEDDLPTMPNILGTIDKVDKLMEGSFRRSYESLSEYCHPNCAGVHMSYVKIDRDNIWANIGSTYTSEKSEPLIGTLVATLELFEKYYNEISDLIDDFIAVCESELQS